MPLRTGSEICPMRCEMADESAKAVTEEDVMKAVGNFLEAQWDLEEARRLGLPRHDEHNRLDHALCTMAERLR